MNLLRSPHVVERGNIPIKPSFGEIVEAVGQFLEYSFARELYQSHHALHVFAMVARNQLQATTRSLRCFQALRNLVSPARPTNGGYGVVVRSAEERHCFSSSQYSRQRARL